MKRTKKRPAEPCALMRTIGEIALDRRKGRGWTQGEVADSADLSVAMISSVERGKRSVSIEVLERLATALRMTAAELCGGRP